MDRRIAIGSSLAVAAALAAGVAVLVRSRATSDVEAITAAPDQSRLTAAQVTSLLQSPDFKDQARARRSLGELAPRELEAVLDSLARSPRAEVRLLAVSGASRLTDRTAFGPTLARLAADDPDADVRAAAQQQLGGRP